MSNIFATLTLQLNEEVANKLLDKISQTNISVYHWQYDGKGYVEITFYIVDFNKFMFDYMKVLVEIN